MLFKQIIIIHSFRIFTLQTLIISITLKKKYFNVIYFFDGITLLDGGLVPSFSFQHQAHSGNPLHTLFPYAGTLDSGNAFCTGLPDMVLRRRCSLFLLSTCFAKVLDSLFCIFALFFKPF